MTQNPISSGSPGGVITRDSVLAQAMSLPAADRETVAELLLLSVDRPADDDDDSNASDRYPLSAAWAAEIDRRVAAVTRGEVDGIDAKEHLRKLRERYAR